MLLLGMLVSTVNSGGVQWVHLGLVTAEAAGFAVFMIFVAPKVVDRLEPGIDQMQTQEAPLVLALALCLGLSVAATPPIFFPISWHNSKTPGFVLHADLPNFHHFSAFVSMSSVAARFFPPQSAGAGATVGQSGFPFRIDHDEKFNQTTHVQYHFLANAVPGLVLTGDSIAASTPRQPLSTT